jgi:hypothetical protein
VKQSIRAFVTFQTVLIMLKLDRKIDHEWRFIFIIYWAAFAIVLAFTFALIMMVLSKCCGLIFAEIEKSEMKGVFLLFLWFFGIMIFSSSVMLSVVRIFMGTAHYSK